MQGRLNGQYLRAGKAARIYTLLVLSIFLGGCVSFDRMITPITEHSKHYSFTHSDAVKGGMLVGGLTEYQSDYHSSADYALDDSINWSSSLSEAINAKRKGYGARAAGPLVDVLDESHYRQMLNRYRTERWIDLATMAIIREHLPERYIVLARIENTSEYQSSNCSKRKKKKKKDEEGNETDEDEDGPDIYDVYRTATRTAKISADVFDLAQDIIVWSGTRDASTENSRSYKTEHYIGEYSYQEIYPYPNYPSWTSTFYGAGSGLANHMPHKSD